MSRSFRAKQKKRDKDRCEQHPDKRKIDEKRRPEEEDEKHEEDGNDLAAN